MRVPREGINDLTNRSRLDSSIKDARLEFGLERGLEKDFLADASILDL